MNKPVITADTPAIRELFEDGELMFVKVADHVSLAKAVMILKNNKEMANSIAQKRLSEIFKIRHTEHSWQAIIGNNQRK